MIVTVDVLLSVVKQNVVWFSFVWDLRISQLGIFSGQEPQYSKTVKVWGAWTRTSSKSELVVWYQRNFERYLWSLTYITFSKNFEKYLKTEIGRQFAVMFVSPAL